MTRLQANSLLLLAGAIWGMGFVAQSSAMAAVGPWTYTAARFALATLTLAPFVYLERRRAGGPLSPRDRRSFALVGVLLFLGSMLQQIGLLSTTVTNSGFITGLYVVMTPVFGLLLLGNRPHWVVWPAAILALLGILLTGGGGLTPIGAGDGLTVVAAAAFALQIMLVGFFGRGSGRPFALSCTQFAVAAALAAVGMLALERPASAGLAAVWPEIVYGGSISAGLAFTLQSVGQRHTSAPQAAIFLSSEALFAALFAALFLGERTGTLGLVGCLMIFAAMLGVELVPGRAGASGRPAAALEGERG